LVVAAGSWWPVRPALVLVLASGPSPSGAEVKKMKATYIWHFLCDFLMALLCVSQQGGVGKKWKKCVSKRPSTAKKMRKKNKNFLPSVISSIRPFYRVFVFGCFSA
jgi:hypothetical protein